jgi:predicted MFS family arabinose efflux permease
LLILLMTQARPAERSALLGLNCATTYFGPMVGTADDGAIYAHAGFVVLGWCAAPIRTGNSPGHS